MFHAFYRCGFDGGMSGMGDIIYIPTSSHVFANHVCDQTPNYAGLAEVESGG
jgi:hypothetical protein